MGSQRNRSRPPGLNTFQAVTVGASFGGSLGILVAAGVIAGQWLDGQLGTSLVFTLIGVVLGFATALTSTVRLYQALLRRSEQEWRRTTSPAHGAPAAADRDIQAPHTSTDNH